MKGAKRSLGSREFEDKVVAVGASAAEIGEPIVPLAVGMHIVALDPWPATGSQKVSSGNNSASACVGYRGASSHPGRSKEMCIF
jgi:hypothetical protein